MLHDLFPRHHERYEKSRFGAELEAFAAWSVGQGHLRHPLRLHLHRVHEVLGRSDRFQAGAMFHEADLLQAFVVSGIPASGAYLYLCTGRIFSRFLAEAGRLIPIEHTDATSLLRRRYQRHLSDVRGFSEQSLHQHGGTVADFLSRGISADRGLSELTAAGDCQEFRVRRGG